MALNIIFMGTPEFAVPILDTINNSKHKVLGVYTQPPSKKNRGQKFKISPVHEYSEKAKLNIRYPEKLDTVVEYEYLKNLKPHVVIVVAYGKIIPLKILNLKNIEFINIHASLLPKWRGAAPIQRSIMNCDKVSGISIMKIVSQLDSGPTLIQAKIDIDSNTNYETLSKKMSHLGASKILDALDLIEKKKANYISQNNNEATYARKIDKSEAKIKWDQDARKILAQINALYPNPGCWFDLNGVRIKIIKAIEVRKQGKAGEVLSDNFTIACLKNAIQILELKKEGKKTLTAKEFLKGNKLKVGENIIDE